MNTSADPSATVPPRGEMGQSARINSGAILAERRRRALPTPAASKVGVDSVTLVVSFESHAVVTLAVTFAIWPYRNPLNAKAINQAGIKRAFAKY